MDRRDAAVPHPAFPGPWLGLWIPAPGAAAPIRPAISHQFFCYTDHYLLQQSLSLLFRNQAVALVTSIVGSFAGLFSLFFPIWVQKCLLWGYYGVLNLAAMDWDPVTRATDFYWITVDKSGIVLLALWFVALLALGRTLFIRKEV